MAKKISQLPTVDTLNPTTIIPVVKNGVTSTIEFFEFTDEVLKSVNFSSPPPIGNITPALGMFTTLISNGFITSNAQITGTLNVDETLYSGDTITAGGTLTAYDAMITSGIIRLGGTGFSYPSIRRNGTGIEIKLADNTAYATVTARAKVNIQTGTTYTVSQSDTGAIVDISNSSSVIVTLPNTAPVGTALTICQAGTGQITFEAQAGGSVNSRDGALKTGGQYALATVYVRANESGTGAAWILGGDIVA